ncbi:hypothetical protein QBC32DRAFT_345650 [Pseudoneurospora amorphoporcata]|uniref:DUF8004 domain-containing protein n=1 Tax=Pseudoneurospora amorphoporcata TaxID=241081 RepID=A0AAN6NRY7_9PEZI|nr:hypothetical protein QBC32DRAFT_345650 [Pseudoneurospora amorphoporcata]
MAQCSIPRSWSDGGRFHQARSQPQIGKSIRFGSFTDRRRARNPDLKRWDGASRTSQPWDCLGKRDPELWHRKGNCLVYLYGRGQSNRSPSFKVPFNTLLATQCQPLIARYIRRDIPETLGTGASQIELYIPAPTTATEEEALRHYLDIRNFFAWVFRRSMVGEHLGATLIRLLHTMTEFRCLGVNNADDLLSYADEEGYLEMCNQLAHALGVLHFAEYCQNRRLYIEAFTHCTGMFDELYIVPEYQVITSATRRLLRQAKAEMDERLGQATLMLRNFLKEDLSQAHLGLSVGGRSHLERFRTFLHAYFATKIGYYPPTSIDQRYLIFPPGIYRTMRDDIEALYELLVDNTYTPSESIPASAQGGLCTLQCVHGFDVRKTYPPLPHPLPLLPELPTTSASRRTSWLHKADKLKPDQRVVEHAALAKASNRTNAAISRNPLVIAYQRYEEDCVFSPIKIDRQEKISQVDARKVRWILVYAIYQVLRACTQASLEGQDVRNAYYNMAVSTENLPPWDGDDYESSFSTRFPRGTRQDGHAFSMSLPNFSLPTPLILSSFPAVFTYGEDRKIRPDIDHFALLHARTPSGIATDPRPMSPPNIPTRVHSLTRSISHSFNAFTGTRPVEQESTSPNRSRRASYHEIVIQGYGNGTNDVHPGNSEPTLDSMLPQSSVDVTKASDTRTPEQGIRTQGITLRSPSTASTSSNNTTGSSTTSRKTAVSASSTAPSFCSSPTSPKALVTGEELVRGMPVGRSDIVPPLPRRSSRRRPSECQPDPLRIRKTQSTTSLDILGRDDNEPRCLSTYETSNDPWAQYADVGGLRDLEVKIPV